MDKEASKIWGAVLLTAIIVGGGMYYFNSRGASDSSGSKPVLASGQTSEEYAVMGREVWSAFQCSAWASEFKDPAEAERLFTFGYKQGKTFFAAATAGKVKDEDISNIVPIGVTMHAQGPTKEFMLGRIYEGAMEEALDEVYGENYNPENVRETIARNKYASANCQLIGK